MASEQEDVESNCLKNCINDCRIEDEAMIKEFDDEEHIVATKETLYETMPEDIVEQILTTPILLFQDMMSRMQQAIIAGHKKNMKPGGETARNKDLLKQKFNDEGYAFDEKDISMGLDITHFSAPILLDVKKTTELFRKGQLNEYISQRRLLSNKFQRELILGLEGPSADVREDENDNESPHKMFRLPDGSPHPSSFAKPSSTRSEDSTAPTVRKRPNVPQLHPLNPNIKKVLPNLSPRARALPNVPTLDNNTVTKMLAQANNLQPHGMIPQNNRRLAVAVRKNPNYLSNARTRVRQLVPQRVSIRSNPTPNTLESELKVVSVESLKNSVPQVKIEAQEKPQGMMSNAKIVPKPIVSLPSSITVVPVPPENEEHIFKNVPVSTTKAELLIPEHRPASARKSPHNLTMYSNSVTPVAVQPRKPVENQSQKVSTAQPRQYAGRSPGSSTNEAESSGTRYEDLMDNGMPQIMSTEGGVSSFISKLNSVEKNDNKSDQTTTIDKGKASKGGWILGCQPCGQTYALTNDYSFRQHLMIEHSIEVDDKEIFNIKFFANTIYKCKKCDACFFKDRSVHHQTCSPEVKIDDAFQELPAPVPSIQTEVIKCGICETKLDTRIDLRHHLEETHAELANFTLIQPKYRCSQCLKAFTDSGSLTLHVKNCKTSVATKETVLEIARSLLKCGICTSTHKKVSEVQICYAEKKLIRCMLCLYTCISRQNFSRHMLNFHRRNNVGIACPFCPNSEVAAVRAQFEHIVSQHYSPAIESEDKRLSTATPTPMPGLQKTASASTLIRLPPGQTARQYLQQSGVTASNSGIRSVYRKDNNGQLILSSRTAFTSIIPPGAPTGLRQISPMGVRPVAVTTSQLAGTAETPVVGILPMQISSGGIRHVTNAMTEAGLRPVQITSAGIRQIQVSSAGMRPVHMLPGGLRPVQMSPAGLRPVQMSAAGIRPVQITSAGIRQIQVSSAGMRPVQMLPAGLRPVQLSSAGIRPVQVSSAGIRPVQLSSAGIRQVQVSSAGIRQVQVSTAGIRPLQLSTAGIRQVQVSTAGIRPLQVSSAGIRQIQVSTAGIRQVQVTSAGVRLAQISSAGNSPTEITSAGNSQTEITAAGNSPAEITSAGNSPAKIISTGYSPTEITSAGNSPAKIISTGNSLAEITSNKYSSAETTSEGNSSAEITSTGNNSAQITSAGNSPVQVSSATTPPAQISSATTLPAQVSSTTTPPAQVSSATTPPAQVSSATTPPAQVSSATTPSAQISSVATPPVQVSSAATPPARVSSAATPPAQVSSATPPAQVSSTATPPAKVSSTATPPVRASSPAVRPVQSTPTAPRNVQLTGSALRPIHLSLLGMRPGQNYRQVTVTNGPIVGVRNNSPVSGNRPVGSLPPGMHSLAGLPPGLRPPGVAAGVRTFGLPQGSRQVRLSPGGIRTVGVRSVLLSAAPGTPVRYVVTPVRPQAAPGISSTAETQLVSSANRPLATPSTTTSAARMASPLIENKITTVTNNTPSKPLVAAGATANTVTTDSTTSAPKTIATVSDNDTSQVEDMPTESMETVETNENSDEILGF